MKQKEVIYSGNKIVQETGTGSNEVNDFQELFNNRFI